ncbi:MAG: peptide chain release factor N(5)-glutamine methyltransferase [Chloroflexi bacterium]|nr:peptide chain release factor N(5)-glutamine methyltransferase [Chloroflexota bacterium]MCY3588787.1 peptide chain release factor N(5)-glutamine methyltransferase [Chloroflexota bacterium]MCY3686507.1 peptide chain release factor N(5)-glutamine methyltransferase [Chloroflexota bacterium]MDE2708231.1 peptide chain release factor N(5)-glutamine methyltransferase [Chloroflexota bacterium]
MTTPAMLRDAWLAAAAELESAEIDDARFEAEVLLRHATGLNRAQLYASLTDEIDPAAQQRFEAAIAERTTRKPLAYITGTREFYRLEFRVTPDVLIPRPESELLVDAALDHIRQARFRTPQVADVGAGSGAVGIALARHRRGVNLICSDVSRNALLVARDNAQRLLRRPKTTFIQGDLLTPLPGPFHCVVANLPYIPEDRLAQLEPEVAEHEPRVALTPGTRGTELILRLITQLPSRLHSNGVAVLEVDPGQEIAIADAARQMLPNAEVTVLDDVSQQPRAVRIIAG